MPFGIDNVVIVMAFRERRLGRGMAEDDTAAQQASDARVLATIFTAIVGGMLFSTVLNLFFIPVLYVVVKSLLSKVQRTERIEEVDDVVTLGRRDAGQQHGDN